MSMKLVGMTKEGTFQAGMRRTVQASAEQLWQRVVSAEGQSALGGICALDRDTDGVSTWVPGSHYRRRLDQGLLQVRVLAATNGRATIALHMENLPDSRAREAALAFMDHALNALSAGLRDPAMDKPASNRTT